MDLLLKDNPIKCFIVVRDNIVCDFWIAETLEEAMADNPDAIVEEIKKTWVLNQKYVKDNK